MDYKLKKIFGKKLLSLALMMSFVLPVSYMPVFTPKAQALLGVGDINIESVPTIVKFVLETVGSAMAQRMVDDMVKETIKWANSGFEDNPAYVTDLGGFLVDVADQTAGEFIEGSDLNFLCSPFQNTVRLSLRAQYGSTLNNPRPFQCTVSGIQGNLENFLDGNFSRGGGWNTWFEVTQNSSNNPYGAYMEAKIELDTRIAEKVNLKQTQLSWGSGFLSWSDCIKTEEETGRCLERGPVQTPGSVIHNQLNESLGSGMARLISANSLDQLVGAFAAGLLERYVFGSKGLFASNTRESIASGREMLDIDNDNIPDGWDYSGNGQLNICHHGLLDPNRPPSNSNCVGSKVAGSTPFFIPICEALNDTVRELTKYNDFIVRNSFREEYANTWLNRSVTVAGAVDNFEGVISRYEIIEYDPALFAIGKFLKEHQRRIKNLSTDGRLHDNRRGRPDEAASEALRLLRKNTLNLLRYLERFQANIGRCDAPNVNALSQIPIPDIELEPDERPLPPSVQGTSCSASTETASVGDTVTWSVQTSLSDVTYLWTGNNIDSSIAPTVSVKYTTEGTKMASVTLSGVDGNGLSHSGTILCDSRVVVTDPNSGDGEGPSDAPLQ